MTDKTHQDCRSEERKVPIKIPIPIHYIRRCNRVAEKTGESSLVVFYNALNVGLAQKERGEA